MDKQVAPKSKTRIVASAILILGFFIWDTFFFYYLLSTYPHTTPDKLTVWFGIVIAGLLIFVGIAVGAGINAKTIAVGAIVCAAWSLGLVLLPVPEGYAETVYGGWTILLMLLVAFYFEYEKSRKRKAQAGKKIEEELQQ